ncbi:MAG: hypothetical protein DRI26_08000, partial [Chloroflexi bacterium]
MLEAPMIKAMGQPHRFWVCITWTVILSTGVATVVSGTEVLQNCGASLLIRVLDDFLPPHNEQGSWWDIDGTMVYQRSIVEISSPAGRSGMRVRFDKGRFPWSFFAFRPHPDNGGNDFQGYSEIFVLVYSESRLQILLKVEDTSGRGVERAVQVRPHTWTPARVNFSIGRIDKRNVDNILFFAAPGKSYARGEFVLAMLCLVSLDVLTLTCPTSVIAPPRINRGMRCCPDAYWLMWEDTNPPSCCGIFEVEVSTDPSFEEPYTIWTTNECLLLTGLEKPEYWVRVRLWTHLPREWGYFGSSSEWSAVAKVELPPIPKCPDSSDIAIVMYEHFLDACREIGYTLGEALTLLSLADCHFKQGNYSQAEVLYLQSHNKFESLSDLVGAGNSLLGLGNCLINQGKYIQANEVLGQALQLYVSTSDNTGKANCLLALANSLLFLGDFGRALTLIRQSQDIYRELDDNVGLANALLAEARYHYKMGNYRIAISSYTEAQELKAAIGDSLGEANALLGLGSCYERLNEFTAAEEAYSSAYTIYLEQNDKEGMANTLLGLGTALTALGKYELAIERYNSALQIYRSLHNQNGEASSLLGLGNCYTYLRELLTSIQHYEAALARFESLNERSGVAACAERIGWCYYSLERYREALNYYSRSLAYIKALEPGADYQLALPDTLWKVYFGMANCYYKMGNRDKAVEYWIQAANVIENLRSQLANVSYISSFMINKFVVYYSAAPALRSEAPDLAFRFAERAKARILVDLMETAVIAGSRTLAQPLQELTAPSQLLAAARNIPPTPSVPAPHRMRGTPEYVRSAVEQLKQLSRRFREENPALGDLLTVDVDRLNHYIAESISHLDSDS